MIKDLNFDVIKQNFSNGSYIEVERESLVRKGDIVTQYHPHFGDKVMSWFVVTHINKNYAYVTGLSGKKEKFFLTYREFGFRPLPLLYGDVKTYKLFRAKD